ncbi:MAG: cation:proton antiporter [Erysipelotrichaceae bacterium]|nr:cation:proton antiporter [Erysipelotrichaceae bacterium]
MLASLALMILVGLSLATIVEKLKLPRIIGLLVTGIVLGPYVLNVMDESILNISSQLRQIALIIILIKAGLTLNLEDLKKVGRPALLMAFLPATFELIAYIIFAPLILNVTRVEAALMGAVLAAVSPAVVVPRMVYLIENQYGTEKGIPQMILAGASCDDIYVIVLFSTFVTMIQGGSVNILDFVNVPISIILGVVLGIIAGFLLALLFKQRNIDNTIKVMIIIGVAFLLMSIETWLEAYISLSGLLAVVSMSCVIKLTSSSFTSSSLASITGKLWLFAEIMLFVLVGAAVDIRYALSTGIGAILMIFAALVIRAIGVWICLIGTNLNIKERLFCVIAYLPKATVQAAIGSVPLSLGLSCGPMILSVAVLAILITAPLGAIGIDKTYTKILVKEII